MFSMFAESTPTCGGSSIIAATTPASISTVKTTRLRDAASYGLRPTNRACALQRFQHIYALFLYALFSLDYVFLRDFECFFFPSHDYLKRTKHPVREYAILFAGKGFYLTYMLILPVVLLGKSPLLVALAFVLSHLIIGLSVALVFQTTHTVDSTYFPSAATSSTTGSITSSRRRPTMRPSSPLVGWLVGRAQPPYRPSSVPFCVPHSLCSADPDREADRRRIWRSLSATSHHDGRRSNIILLLLKQLGNQDRGSSVSST